MGSARDRRHFLHLGQRPSSNRARIFLTSPSPRVTLQRNRGSVRANLTRLPGRSGHIKHPRRCFVVATTETTWSTRLEIGNDSHADAFFPDFLLKTYRGRLRCFLLLARDRHARLCTPAGPNRVANATARPYADSSRYSKGHAGSSGCQLWRDPSATVQRTRLRNRGQRLLPARQHMPGPSGLQEWGMRAKNPLWRSR